MYLQACRAQGNQSRDAPIHWQCSGSVPWLLETYAPPQVYTLNRIFAYTMIIQEQYIVYKAGIHTYIHMLPVAIAQVVEH